MGSVILKSQLLDYQHKQKAYAAKRFHPISFGLSLMSQLSNAYVLMSRHVGFAFPPHHDGTFLSIPAIQYTHVQALLVGRLALFRRGTQHKPTEMRERAQKLIHAIYQPSSQSQSLVLWQDVHIREVGEGERIGHQTTEPNLLEGFRSRLTFVKPKAEGAVNDSLEDVFRKGVGPVHEVLLECGIDGGQRQKGLIGRDEKFISRPRSRI